MKKPHGDNVLFAMVLMLALFGLVMITSIGIPKSIQLSAPNVLYPNCGDPKIDCYLIFKNHLLRLLVGCIALFTAMRIPYRFWKKISFFLFAMTVALLFVLLALGSRYTTFARSWLVLLNTSFQPIEFAKLALIFYLANWMERKSGQIGSFEYGFLPFCIVTGLIVLPILLQPDLGGTLVVIIIAVAMFFAGGARLRHLALGAFVIFVVSLLIVINVSYVKNRFQAFIASDKNCREDYCWQSEQANIAVGSGGFWGKGLTQGVQKSYWLPQASDDFIFAASAEELGFLRIIFVVIVYAIIAYRGFKIALRAPNRFTALTAVGITAWITVQAFMNIAVNVALIPVTGLTLPFVSYGGSSLVSVMIAVGVLLHISRYTSEYAHSIQRRGNRRTYYPQHRNY